MRTALRGRSVININSTPAGGGVAEMLQVLIPLARGLGVDARWLVIEGDERSSRSPSACITSCTDRRATGCTSPRPTRVTTSSVMQLNGDSLSANVVAGDIVVLHDPQTAGMAEHLHNLGVPVVWRCHVGVDDANEWTDEAWTFLRRYLEGYVSAYVFTRKEYAPSWIPDDLITVIRPSIDPLATKNIDMSPDQAAEVLSYVGIIDGARPSPVPFTRADGSPGRVERFADIWRTGPPPDPASAAGGSGEPVGPAERHGGCDVGFRRSRPRWV